MAANPSTSRMAWEQLRDGHLLTDRRLEVYRAIELRCQHCADVTAAEAAEDVWDAAQGTERIWKAIDRLKSSHKRISELVALGLLEHTQIRQCRATGRKAKAYKPTGLMLEVRDTLVMKEALGPSAGKVIDVLLGALLRYINEDDCIKSGNGEPTQGCRCSYCQAVAARIIADQWQRRRS